MRIINKKKISSVKEINFNNNMSVNSKKEKFLEK
jgi:hypothetical protein